MFSHADLLKHDCEHCPPKDDYGSLLEGKPYEEKEDNVKACLWHKLASAIESQDVLEKLGISGPSEYYDGFMNREASGSFQLHKGGEVDFECMVKDESGIARSLDLNRQINLFSGGTSSSETFSTIKKWMGRCNSEHAVCGSGVRTLDEKIAKVIRFLRIGRDAVVLEEATNPHRYACLSHCWGSENNPIKTTLENKNTHINQGILLKDLPKTFQDAVMVCKELGIDYIWIDSLCIIQNSDEDWNEQASRMAEIYENSYLTIAAVAAKDSTEGLFNNACNRRVSFPIPAHPWIRMRRTARMPEHSDQFRDPLFDDGFVLYKRGWVYQELSLSPRVIHYGREEVIWQCQETTSCEGDPEGIIKIPPLVSANMRLTQFGVQLLWYHIVASYSWRSLTFEKDRLPAIAAFASRMRAPSDRRRYLHGLWDDTIHFDLLWCTQRKFEEGDFLWFKQRKVGESGDASVLRRLPTWSWISTGAPVMWTFGSEFDDWEKIPYTIITKTKYETRGPLLLGDVVEACIVLQAPLVKLRDTDLIADAELTDEYKENELAWGLADWDTPGDAEKYGKQDTEAFGIPLIMQRRDRSGSSIFLFNNALLVAETSEPGKYRRVGVGAMHSQRALIRSEAWLGGEFDAEASDFEKEWHEDFDCFMRILEYMEKSTITLV